MTLLVVQFDNAEAVTAAARRLREAGARRFDAHTPYPVEELDALVPARHRVPAVVLAGGVLGAAAGLAMQYIPAAILYPINIGGRPYASWPAFGPIAFEITVLTALIGGVLGFLWLCRLPTLYHPVMTVPGFERATRDRFFLSIDEEGFDRARLERLLAGCPPVAVTEVVE